MQFVIRFFLQPVQHLRSPHRCEAFLIRDDLRDLDRIRVVRTEDVPEARAWDCFHTSTATPEFNAHLQILSSPLEHARIKLSKAMELAFTNQKDSAGHQTHRVRLWRLPGLIAVAGGFVPVELKCRIEAGELGRDLIRNF